jgi:NTE family protein
LHSDNEAMTRGLADIPFLKDASPEARAMAEAEAEWFSLPGGWPLFHAGEAPDGLYFVLSGSLAAFRGGQEQRLVGYIRAGEPVGEMALVAGDTHTASVYAIRDTELVRFRRETFERLVDIHPQLMRNLAGLMLRRSRENRARNARAEPKVYALVSTSPTIDLRLRARTLAEALSRLGKNVCVIGEEADDMLSEWFDDLERDHDAVFLISPIADTTWFRTCLRQADRVWVLARADAVPSIPLLPEDSFSPVRQFQFVDIVLLHHGAEPRRDASAEHWRQACNAARLFHWRGLDDEDASRLARVVCGQATGLVLSGGGARAYAHLGVIRALREAHVHIDIVGGTSMGGIVAACYAMGWSDDEMEMRIRKAFVDSNPLGDYVLPVVALSRGRRVETRLEEHFGDTLIDDLRVPFFCVSTNLISGAPQVHRSGLLRHALRASISLPGILPPVVDGAQSLLVDGAVTMNFPVEVMKEMHRGPIVGVDVARKSVIDPQDFVDAPDFIGWVTRRGFGSAPPIASLLMHTATLGVDPWTGRDGADILILPEMHDVDLRDWKKFDAAVMAGYEATVAALKRQHEEADRLPLEPAPERPRVSA